MIKYFCDKCGCEIKTDVTAIPMYARDRMGVVLTFIRYNHLCEECTKRFEEVEDQLECEEDFFNDEIIKNIEANIMTEKEKLMEYINNPVTTDARNRMGCDENWYNPYYAIKETFSIDEIQSMSNKEIDNLVRLADEIGLALY